MREKWLPVVGYEGLYEVSNLGRIRRVKIIEPTKKKHGYMQISLVDRNGVRKSFRLHRIVAEAFIPNPEGKPQVNHRDENPENNRAVNLEWATAEENTNYGSRTPILQIDPATLKVIAEYPGQSAASRATGIAVSCINACLRGKQKHAGGYLWEYKYRKIVL